MHTARRHGNAAGPHHGEKVFQCPERHELFPFFFPMTILVRSRLFKQTAPGNQIICRIENLPSPFPAFSEGNK